MKPAGNDPLSSDADMEVELSTQDLLNLTPVSSAPSIARVASIPANPVSAIATAASSPRISVPRMAAAMGVVLIALIAIGALLEFSPPQRVMDRPTTHWSPMPDPVTTVAEEEKPTLFANPFDASEVFELPPGLTRDEARAMVADILLQRAGERRVYTSRNH